MFFFQFEAIKRYVESGGSVMVLIGEGGETRFNTNINFLLEEFGVFVNSGEFFIVYSNSVTTVYAILTTSFC